MLRATRRRGREVPDLVESTDEGGDPTPSRAPLAESVECFEVFSSTTVVGSRHVNAALNRGLARDRAVIEGISWPGD